MSRLSRAAGPLALVLAALALVVASSLTGAYAATKVTTRQLAKNAVTSPKIKDGTIATRDLSTDTVTGLRGATGPQGPAGRGVAGIWALVDATGNLGGHEGVASSARLRTGDYLVIFDRPVSGCALVGSPNEFIVNPTTVTVALEPGSATRARVEVSRLVNPQWSSSDVPFSVLAVCPD